jgi:lipopolysaccharide export LptBFGC system permease protein LptF
LKVLLDLTAHREIVALQTSGLSKLKLLTPFVVFAAILTLASYANSEWIAPDAQKGVDPFHKTAGKPIAARKEKVFSLDLQDGSELVYQSCNWEKQELCDVFWICSFKDIWHMNTLKIDLSPPQGFVTEHFIRNQEGVLQRENLFEVRSFPEIQLEASLALTQFIPFENRSLSTLFQQAKSRGADRQRSSAHLHYKIALPLIPLFSLFAIAPYALRFSRTRSAIFFLACSLFAFIGLMTLLDGMLILAENQVLPPLLAIWGLILGVFTFLLAHALKM